MGLNFRPLITYSNKRQKSTNEVRNNQRNALTQGLTMKSSLARPKSGKFCFTFMHIVKGRPQLVIWSAIDFKSKRFLWTANWIQMIGEKTADFASQQLHILTLFRSVTIKAWCPWHLASAVAVANLPVGNFVLKDFFSNLDPGDFRFYKPQFCKKHCHMKLKRMSLRLIHTNAGAQPFHLRQKISMVYKFV